MKVERLPSGSYRVRIYDYTDREGKKHYKSFTNKNKALCMAEAKEFHSKHKADKILNKKITNPYAELTLSEAYKLYIDMKSDILSPNTVREYEKASKRDFPELLNTKIKYIDSNTLQIALNRLRQTNSPKTIKNKYSFIHSVLTQFEPNKVLKVQLPQAKKPMYNVPTKNLFSTILENAPDNMKIPIILGGVAGLRRSEICALTPNDIFDDGIKIDKALAKDRNNKTVVKQPKTVAGERFVPLSPKIIKLIRQWNFKISPSTITHSYGRICKKLGIEKTRFHDLRHFFVTELYEAKINPLTIKEYSGHESVQMIFNIYAHARRSESTDKQVVSVFDDVNENIKV